ncbi:ABC transporter ATP-binding protein [Methanocaldococcus indicus]|uniref:ABC transporter ATP-binding protein n=1 Tax=Methanocaldococcus indicus TaxID=213231 RepID=UPI003C6D5790
MVLELVNISKSYNNKEVLKNINLKCDNELISILGPSGCGKTTCLKIIAGLEQPSSGKIVLNGKDITKLPPYKRNIGYVPQNYALFPHLTVFENVAYGLKIRKLKKDKIDEKVKNVLDLVNLSGYENYKVTELSGGEQQRVALARALVIEPKILLLDEPLSNLDAKLRVKMRRNIKKIQKNIGITTIYVTHDQEEALSISDRIAVMNNGIFEQVDTPDKIYKNPKTLFVSKFIGNINILPRFIVETLGIDYNENYYYLVRPEHIMLGKGKFCGKIDDIEYLGNLVRYTIKVMDSELICEVHSCNYLYQEGDSIVFDILKDKVIYIKT